jgi:hydroxypyruvate reductase
MTVFSPEDVTGNAIFNPMPTSLVDHPLQTVILSAVRAALDAVNPEQCIRNHVRLETDRLFIGPHQINLAAINRIRVVGGGKAAWSMARALQSILKDRIETGCIAIKSGEQDLSDLGSIKIMKAGHPVPDESSVNAAQAVVDAAAGLTQSDLLVVIISGGASSLLTLPADGLTLDDLQTVTRQLLLSGADIESVNIIRKHLSAVKGGRLAQVAAPARVISLILSDVVGDPIDAIGSGPTAPDSSTYQNAVDRLSHFGLWDTVPKAVAEHLNRGARGLIQETPKPEDLIFLGVSNILIGGNRQAAGAAAQCLTRQGIRTEAVSTPLTGEARTAAIRVVDRIEEEIKKNGDNRPACLVFGGETTVTVRGTGKGARNQELALSAALAVDKIPNLTLLTLGTDGQDGPTDAAGAIVTTDTLCRARANQMDAKQFLNENNSYPFFDALGDLLFCGPTHTNAADLLFAFWNCPSPRSAPQKI